jgi:hypothetical protein
VHVTSRVTRNLRAALGCLGIAAALVGCNESPGAPVRQAQRNAPAAHAARLDVDAPAPHKPSRSASVFVDISGSMAGFFEPGPASPGSGTRAMAVHEEIDTAISEVGLGSATKCTVGDEVTCDGVPAAPAKIAHPGLYRQATSRLDKVLARAPRPPKLDPNQPPPVDLLDDARVTLLITDGMAVAGDTGGSASCARGADPTCVRTLLQQRIADGYGVWLVGVLLPFRGTHFPERTLTTEYLARTRAHVSQLKFDPRNLGVTFSMGALGTTTGGKSTYVYGGYKPLLVFVLGRDPVLARALVGALVTRLRAAPIQPGKMRPIDTVESVELAPLLPMTTHATRFEILARRDQQKLFGASFDPKQLKEFRLEQSARFGGGGLSQKIWCGAGGRAMLYLHYEQTGEHTLPAYLQEHVVLAPSASAPRGVLAAPATTTERRIQTGLNCARLGVSPDIRLDLELRTARSLDDGALAQAWWSRTRWSSDDAWQMPERVYRLEDVVLPILKDQVARPTAWGPVVMHVRRE